MTINDIKNKSIKELAERINQISVEKNNLDMEYNMIVRELWERVPSLAQDPNLELIKGGNNESQNRTIR